MPSPRREPPTENATRRNLESAKKRLDRVRARITPGSPSKRQDAPASFALAQESVHRGCSLCRQAQRSFQDRSRRDRTYPDRVVLPSGSSSLTLFFELLGEHVPCAEEAAFQGGDAYAKDLGDLCIGEALCVAQDEWDTVELRQPQYGILDAPRSVGLYSHRLGAARDPGVQFRVELDEVPAASQSVDPEIVGDSQKPRFEAILRIEGIQAIEGPQERLLNEIFDGNIATCVGVNYATDEPLVAAHELFVGAYVTHPGPFDKLVVRQPRAGDGETFDPRSPVP